MSKIVWVNGISQKHYEDLDLIEKLIKSEDINNAKLNRLVTNLKEKTVISNKYDISFLISFGLGLLLGIGLLLVFGTSLVDLGLYLILLSFFHMWEYTYVSLYHPETLSYECLYLIGINLIMVIQIINILIY